MSRGGWFRGWPDAVPVFRLVSAEFATAKHWCVLAAAILALSWVLARFSALTPAEEPSLRAHAAYAVGLAAALIYGPVAAASASSGFLMRGGVVWFRSLGHTHLAIFTELCAATLIWVWASTVLPAFAVAALSLAAGGSLSAVSLLQAFLLTVLASAPAIPAAAGAARRLGAAAGAVCGAGFNAACFCAPPVIRSVLENPDTPDHARQAASLLLCVIPNLSLGDQSARIAYGWPPASHIAVIAGAGYLTLCSVVCWLAAFALFRDWARAASVRAAAGTAALVLCMIAAGPQAASACASAEGFSPAKLPLRGAPQINPAAVAWTRFGQAASAWITWSADESFHLGRPALDTFAVSGPASALRWLWHRLRSTDEEEHVIDYSYDSVSAAGEALTSDRHERHHPAARGASHYARALSGTRAMLATALYFDPSNTRASEALRMLVESRPLPDEDGAAASDLVSEWTISAARQLSGLNRTLSFLPDPEVMVASAHARIGLWLRRTRPDMDAQAREDALEQLATAVNADLAAAASTQIALIESGQWQHRGRQRNERFEADFQHVWRFLNIARDTLRNQQPGADGGGGG